MRKRIRKIYDGMISRCYNSQKHNYYLYGGRGILICDEWRYSFQKFYDWCMESGYTVGLTIDRIDNNLGYEPRNCKWSTIKEQNINRRSTIMITYNNKSQPLSYWAKELGIPRQTIKARMDRGLTFEQSIY